MQERTFEDTGGARRTDSGVTLIQRQMPVFTQNAPDHDVLVAADESEVFAGFLPYRTWDARPVAGSAGLRPTSWDASHELWGGDQQALLFAGAACSEAEVGRDGTAGIGDPTEVAILNANYLWFDKTEPLKTLLFQSVLEKSEKA